MSLKYINKVEYKNCVGKVFTSKYCGLFKVISYHNRSKVEIEFIETGYRKFCGLSNIRVGEIKDPYFKSLCGVGVVGVKYGTRYKNESGENVMVKQYNIWSHMIKRCYSDKSENKDKTYKGCTVSENFKHYEYFYEWCNKQVGFGNDGWHLDKDLLVKGNKVYSENTCVFLPQELNNLLTNRSNNRGEFPIGVCYRKREGKYSSALSLNKGNPTTLGYYNTPEEAFYAYKEAKEDFIKEQALKWKDKIDPRAYEALMNYRVEITD